MNVREIALVSLLLLGRLLGGAAYPVSETEIDEVAADSDLIFEAVFVKLEREILYKKEIPSKEAELEIKELISAIESHTSEVVYRTWNEDDTPWEEPKLPEGQEYSEDPFSDNYPPQDYDYITVSLGEDGNQYREDHIEILRTLTLRVTSVIKGELHEEFFSMNFVDMSGSTCPHIVMMGNFEKPQRYFRRLTEELDGQKTISYRFQEVAKSE